MIYSPSKFLFIHIPRTAGTSITKALSEACIGVYDTLINTTNSWPFHKHATYKELQKVIPDINQIYVFSFYRETEEIIKSDYRLHKMTLDGPMPEEWKDTVLQSRNESLDDFKIRRWDPWIGNTSAWDWWTGEGVHKYEFNNLQEEWRRLCTTLKLPRSDLPIIDIGNSYG